MTPEGRLAQAERDCVDLHRALFEAIKRIKPRDETPRLGFRTDDLMAVLARISLPMEPEPPQQPAIVWREISPGIFMPRPTP